MLMDKQELLEKASAKFKKDFGVNHKDLGFTYTEFYKNSVLFAKNTQDLENYKKSETISIKAIVLTLIITIVSALFIYIYVIDTSGYMTFPNFWVFTITLLYIIALIGNFYFYHKCKYYENQYKINIFVYKNT